MPVDDSVLNALLLAPSTAPREGVLRTMLFSGTSLSTLKDIYTNAGPGAPDFSNVVTFRGINHFIARGPDTATAPGVPFWMSTDGTGRGTYPVELPSRGYARDFYEYDKWQADSLFKFDDKLLFTAHFPGFGRELWLYDGSAAYFHNINTEFDDPSMAAAPRFFSQEQLFPGLNHDTSGSHPSGFVRVGNLVYFAANSSAPHGRELWVTDGTRSWLAVDVDPYFYDAPAPKQWYEQVPFLFVAWE